MPNNLKNIIIFLAYLGIFLVLFYQFPANDSLLGNWDTWFNLALFETYQSNLVSFLTRHEWNHSSMYPIAFPFLYGEPMFINGILYMVISAIVDNPIYIWYILVSILFTLNSFSLNLIFRTLGKKNILGFIGGLFIGLNNYVLCSIDQLNVVSFYPLFFSIYFLLLFKSKRYRIKHLALSLCFLLIQLYCSGYYFLLGSIIWLMLYIYQVRWFSFKVIIPYLIIFTVLTMPYLRMYIFSDLSITAINPMSSKEKLEAFSFSLNDFFRSHPNNLLYGQGEAMHLIEIMKGYFIGFVLLGSFIVGWILNKRHRKFILLVLLTGFLLASGPTINLGPFTITSPLQIILDTLGLSYFFRTPLRAYTIILVCMIFSSVYFFDFIMKKVRFGYIYTSVIFLLFLMENVPVRFQYYNSTQFIDVARNLKNSVDHLESNTLLLFLPSTILSSNPINDEFDESNREYIYMYWQTQMNQPVANGLNGFVPNSRIKLDEVVKDKNCHNIVKHLKTLNSNYKIIYFPEMRLEFEKDESFYRQCADLTY